MRKIKSENGAITILVLVSVLFMISFLISYYVIVANKVKTQKEMIQETKRIYEPDKTMEEIYNSYFNSDNIIPIYNEQQLEIALSGIEQNELINGKYYNFKNDANTVYIIMNKITLERLEGENFSIGNLNANFIGQQIEVLYRDENNNAYPIQYLEENNYGEPSYDIKIIPRFLSENGEIAENAKISIKDKNGNYIEQEGTGETTIKVKRLETIEILGQTDDYKGTLTIEGIKKEDDIQDYNLVLQQYMFSVNLTTVPNDATITYSIDGKGNQTTQGNLSGKYLYGTKISVSVAKDDYTVATNEYEINNSDIQDTIEIEKLYKYKVIATPSNAKVTLTVNGQETTLAGSNEVNVVEGTKVDYYVKADYYQAQSGSYTVNSAYTKSITLSANPEQTLPSRLIPVSASDSPSGSVNDKDDALKSADKSASLKYAELQKGEAILLKFNIPANTILNGAKITMCEINYNVGYALKNGNITLELVGNGISYASTTKNNISYPLANRYTWNVTEPNNINAGNLLKKCELKITCTNRGCNVFGSDIQIKYINI